MTMSCPEVVYQAYYPYLYQRPSAAPAAHSSSRTPPFAPFTHQYDRFNVQRSLEQPSTSSLGESAASASSGASVGAASSSYHPLSHHPPSSVGSVSSGGGGVGSPGPGSPPLSSLRHKDEEAGGPRSAEGGVPEEDDSEALHSVDLDSSRGSTGGHAQYLSANCVVFTHYSGDAAAVVDEHFSRALAYADSKAAAGQSKESSPMTSRNFPASFWNSNYHSPVSVASVSGLGAAGVPGVPGMPGVAGVSHPGDLYGDPYHHAASAPADPWHTHYQQYSAAAHHHRAVHDYHHHHNMAAHAAQYGGLLLPPTRLPAHAHQYTKEWAPGGHHPHHPHHSQGMSHHHGLEAAGYSAYPGMAGLEAQVQETSKDLYWI